jgi:uncharacterized Zn finger protein
MYDYYDFAPYVPVAKRQENARKKVAKKLGNKVNPIVIEGKKISQTFWGNAWCTHLETYSDFENRMPRGRTYVRNGSVVHLEIDKGIIKSYVAGTETYNIEIEIKPMKQERWEIIKQKCSGEIGSVVELLQGKLSKHILAIVTNKETGLFPSPEEIQFDCSCPDWADMCKHVAATLYGVGALLDKKPELFFTLRGVDHLELIDTSVSIVTDKKDSDTLDEGNLEDIFGIELSDSLEMKPQSQKSNAPKKSPKRKKAAKKSVKKSKKVIKKTVKKAVKKSVKKTIKKAVKKTVKKAVKKTGKKK